MKIPAILNTVFNPMISILILSATLSFCSTSHHQSDMTTSTYWVNSYRVPCEGVAPMECLQIKRAEEEDWQYFYSQITGFDFEPGHLYKIEVQEEKLDPDQLPADASSIKYSLISVLEKKEDPFFSIFGTYQGTLPCADCEGIETVLTLAIDGSYTLDSRYLGKQEEPFKENGNFELDRVESLIILNLTYGDIKRYQVGDQFLFHLDNHGKRIEGDLAEQYKLIKQITDPDLEDRKWVLTQLMGQEVVLKPGNTDATILFDSQEERAAGSTSCNRYNCSYKLLPDGGIKISLGMTSLMACENMDTETLYNQMLPKVVSYSINDHILSFKDTEKATIAQYRLAEEGE